jgi:hypothetical protein
MTEVRKVKREVALSPERSVHNQEDLTVFQHATSITELGHDIRIWQELASGGRAHEADIADEDVAFTNLAQDCLADRRRASDSRRVGVQDQRRLEARLDSVERRLQRYLDEAAADISVTVALPG